MKEVATRKGSEVAVFDPRETAAEIHVTNAALLAAKAAKDPASFREALCKNLDAKADFYLQGYKTEFPTENVGNRHTLDGDSSDTIKKRTAFCKQYGFGLRTVQRFKRIIEDKNSVMEDKMTLLRRRFIDETEAANFSSESVEWFTPKAYIEAARECLGEIELDPASSAFANKVVRAKKYFTAKQDGIEQDWFGRVFMNPPYGKRGKDSLAGLFCNKAIEEFEAGRVKEAIILVNSVHSQEWQRPLWQLPVCLVDHRIQFVSGDGEENKNPTFQNAFFYLGSNITKFKKEFAEFGYVLVPA